MRLLVRFACNAVALFVAAWALSGVTYGDEWWSLLIAAAVFTVVNMWLKPIVTLLSLPFIILTLGLFTLVVNALMLQITSWLAGALNLDFHVDSFFWDAILGALIITVVASILNAIVPDPDRSRR